MLKTFCLLASTVLMSAASLAQSAPPGEGPWRPAPLWFGAESSTFNPDYSCQNSSPFFCWSQQKMGVSTFVDMNRLLLHRVGAEGEARFLRWSGSGSLTMTSYLGGPRIELLRYSHAASPGALARAAGIPPVDHQSLTLHGKFLIRNGSLSLRNGLAGSGHYFVIAPGHRTSRGALKTSGRQTRSGPWNVCDRSRHPGATRRPATRD
jgi:hypothetical protein